MASWLTPLLTSSLDIDVRLLDGTTPVDETRKQVEVKIDKDRRELCPVYFDGETVQGEVVIRSRDGKKWAHDGLRIELIGSIEMFYDRNQHHPFQSLSRSLAPATQANAPSLVVPFSFPNVEKPYESYHGINVRLRYYLRTTLSRRMASGGDIVKDRELFVQSYRIAPEANNAIKMEVGIEDCLHIEFEYNKSK